MDNPSVRAALDQLAQVTPRIADLGDGEQAFVLQREWRRIRGRDHISPTAMAFSSRDGSPLLVTCHRHGADVSYELSVPLWIRAPADETDADSAWGAPQRLVPVTVKKMGLTPLPERVRAHPLTCLTNPEPWDVPTQITAELCSRAGMRMPIVRVKPNDDGLPMVAARASNDVIEVSPEAIGILEPAQLRMVLALALGRIALCQNDSELVHPRAAGPHPMMAVLLGLALGIRTAEVKRDTMAADEWAARLTGEPLTLARTIARLAASMEDSIRNVDNGGRVWQAVQAFNGRRVDNLRRLAREMGAPWGAVEVTGGGLER